MSRMEWMAKTRMVEVSNSQEAFQGVGPGIVFGEFVYTRIVLRDHFLVKLAKPGH
jgi:hypothetical protein